MSPTSERDDEGLPKTLDALSGSAADRNRILIGTSSTALQHKNNNDEDTLMIQ